MAESSCLSDLLFEHSHIFTRFECHVSPSWGIVIWYSLTPSVYIHVLHPCYSISRVITGHFICSRYGIIPMIGQQKTTQSSIMHNEWRVHPSCQRKIDGVYPADAPYHLWHDDDS